MSSTRVGWRPGTRAVVTRLSYGSAPDAPPRRRPRLPARRARRDGVRPRRPHEDGHGDRETPGLGRQGLDARGRRTTSASRPSRRRTRRASAAPTRSPTRPAWRGRSFPPRSPENRPAAVALVDAARLARRRSPDPSSPRRRSRAADPALQRSPTCRTPRATRSTRSRPLGAKAAGGAQVMRVGDVARPPGLRTTDIAGRDPFALARAHRRLPDGGRAARAAIASSSVSAEDPAFAMPAAAWAAKAGDPVLFVHRNSAAPGDEGRARGPRPARASTSSGRRRR